MPLLKGVAVLPLLRGSTNAYKGGIVKIFHVGNRWLLGLCAALASFSASPQTTEAARAEYQAAAQAAIKATVAGPADIKLIDQAALKLPQGLGYIPAAEAGRLLTAMGNRTGEGLLGMVLSPGPEADWFVVMRFHKSGYIKDDDARDWKTEELLSGLREGTEEGNKERRSRGISEIQVVGWVEAPKYDAGTHRLVWSLESKEKGAPADAERGVNYNTYALGRDGYISMNLVTGMKQIQAQKPIAHTLLASLQYNDSKGYGDFNSATDHIAEYGLAALVGGIAAKKLGLFLWRPSPLLILMAFLAAPQLIKAWKFDPHAPENAAYYTVTPAKRFEYALYYVALAAFLAVMSYDVHEMLEQLRVRRGL